MTGIDACGAGLRVFYLVVCCWIMESKKLSMSLLDFDLSLKEDLLLIFCSDFLVLSGVLLMIFLPVDYFLMMGIAVN